MENLNKALRLIRVYHDLNQKELAEKLGIVKSYLSEIESGKKMLTIPLLCKYSEVFTIPVSSIVLFAEKLEGVNDASGYMKLFLHLPKSKREHWLDKLKKIEKGERLSIFNVVRLIVGDSFAGYGVITGISEKRFYYIHYEEYTSAADIQCIRKSEGHFVNRSTGSTNAVQFEPIESEEELEDVSRIIATYLKNNAPTNTRTA